MPRTIKAADLFCGAGGTSTGLAQACEELGLKLQLTAVNHWPVAIETHSANHPDAAHFCASLDHLRPADAVPGGKLDLLLASPECTHHSVARGGKPINDQSRASAWHVVRWAEELRPRSILIENVPEFETWGPLNAKERPIQRLRGQLFLSFVGSLRALGYTVDWRVLNAADYGDPTTRKRIILQARLGRRITWPDPTHAPEAHVGFFGGRARWRSAREVIDWSLQGESIFRRKRPLADTTLARIEAGIRKFWGNAAEPFLVILRQHADGRSINEPLPALCASGGHVGLIEPFIVPQFGTADARSINAPLGTVTTTSRGVGLVEPFVISAGGPVVEARPVSRPMPTVLTRDRLALIEPFLVPNFGERNGQKPRCHSINEPLPTVTSHGAGCLVQPFLTKFYGSGDGAVPISEPVPTVTTKDRFGLVEQVGLDIFFRMLQPHELAGAMGFPADYKFTGGKSDQVKQVGNAVPVNLARALCREVLNA